MIGCIGYSEHSIHTTEACRLLSARTSIPLKLGQIAGMCVFERMQTLSPQEGVMIQARKGESSRDVYR